MKAEKITERFPFTFPKIAEVNSWLPLWLLKKMLPKADHLSGTTPRWSKCHRGWRVTHAVVFRPETKEVLVADVATLGESQAVNVCGYFDEEQKARDAQRQYIREFWALSSARLHVSLKDICNQHGGRML